MTDQQTSFFNEMIQKRRLEEGDEYSRGTRDSITLWHAVNDYKSGEIQLPPHQREKSWLPGKDREYITTLCNDSTPPGCFEFYQLKLSSGRYSLRYLNDGSQRLRASCDFYENPQKYGVTKEDATYILRQTSYPYTLKIHRSHQEALIRFQTVNNNVPLTSYQIAIGDVVYCTGSENYHQWQEFIERLHKKMEIITARVVDKPIPNQGTKDYFFRLHVLRRHDLSLYLRYVNNDKSYKDYEPNIRLDISSGGYFEKELAKKLAALGIDQAQQKLEELFRILELETTLVEGKWHSVREDGGHFIRTSNFRWLLDCAIWRRAVKVQPLKWENFLYKFLKETRGTTVLNYLKEEQPSRLNVTISRVGDLPRVCRIINTELLDEWEEKRERIPTDGMRAGWHNSHIEDFKTNGNGPTIREPGITNMSRGANPMDKTQLEVDDLD